MNLVVLTIIGKILLLSIVVYGDNPKRYDALIFDRIDRTLFHLPPNLTKGKCGNWAIACAANPSNPEDKKLIDKSIGKTPLYEKEMYDPDDSIGKVKRNGCDQPFELSLTFNVEKRYLEFGYEIYYERINSDKHYTSKPIRYKTVAQATETLRKPITGVGKFVVSEVSLRIETAIKDEDAIWYKGQKMDLVWIPMFKVSFNFPRMILKKVMYEIRRNSTWPVTIKCEPKHYILGKEVYENFKKIGDVDVDELYEKQNDILKDFKLPKPSCSSAESCPIEENPCSSNDPCLKKVSLIPIDQFHLFSDSSLSCSNTTTVPTWKTMVQLLEKLDQFLYALFRFIRKPIHVVAGTIGILELPKISEVYLDPKNKLIPAPDTIYKIINYTVPKCNPEMDTCEYSAIVFIHNDPNFDSKKKMCEGDDNITTSGGWGTITMNDKRERIYVCRYSEKVFKKMPGWLPFTKPKSLGENLSLTRFPVIKADGRINVDNDIEGDVIKMFDKLATEQDDLDFNELIAIAKANFDHLGDDPEFMGNNDTK